MRGWPTRLLAENRALATARAGWGGAFASLGTLAYYAAYAVIVWRTVAGGFSIGDLAFLAGAFQRLRGCIEGLLLGFTQIAGQAQYLDDLFSFFAIAPAIRSPAQPVPMPSADPRRASSSRMSASAIPAPSAWALRGTSASPAAGETLALVGENGAGKTTIVKLMTRLYDPTRGPHPARRPAAAGLRPRRAARRASARSSRISSASTSPPARTSRSAGSRRATTPTASPAAAARGLADAVIARLPEGYDQPLGKRFAGGLDLSGGEWQKIALSRAYMREAEILILDEPTAALDARAEYDVFARFREFQRGRTAVLISHRFSTVRMADRILVLEGGRVLEAGSHAALMARGGRYAELFELQAGRLPLRAAQRPGPGTLRTRASPRTWQLCAWLAPAHHYLASLSPEPVICGVDRTREFPRSMRLRFVAAFLDGRPSSSPARAAQAAPAVSTEPAPEAAEAEEPAPVTRQPQARSTTCRSPRAAAPARWRAPAGASSSISEAMPAAATPCRPGR